MDTKRYFQKQGKEYVFTDYHTKRPMLNYSWNSSFLSAFNHVGTGHGLYCDKTTITATYIDPRGRVKLINDGNRFFYLRDTDNGVCWNIGGYPTNTSLDEYRCTMGLGYAIYESSLDGIRCNARIFVNDEDACEIWSFTLTNTTDEFRRIQLFPLLEWSLEGYVAKSDYFSYLSSEYDAAHTMLYAYNQADERLHNRYNGFMTASCTAEGYDSSLSAFLGTYGSYAAPDALAGSRGHCTNTVGTCERLAGALEFLFPLQPGESKTIHLLIGSCETKQQALEIRQRLFACGHIDAEFQALCARKEELVERMMVDTPDERINRLFNTWTKQQVVLCSEVGRGNSRGYRDVLQDAWGYASFDTEAARIKIEEALSHQYADGHAPRGWLPLDDRYYSDSPVWITMAVNEYIKESGNFSFLEKSLPFLDSGVGSVLDHCLRAVRHLYRDRGSHGLVLAHNGDWNDSLTGIGKGGKGETAWTTIALHFALLELKDIAARLLKDEALVAELDNMAVDIQETVNKVCWDGNWFLEGYDDDGNPVGSHAEKEGSIYLNPQTWAVISRITTSEREKTAMQQVDNRLTCTYGMLTLAPPYTSHNPKIGRLTGFVPGIWENGCPYCHGSAFKIVADCLMGRGNEAYDTLSRVMPDHPDNPIEQSGCEPYAFTNMYLGPENPRAGFAMFGWISGTAGWMFRAVTQGLLGFHSGYDSFVIEPCIPQSWPTCSLKRRFRENVYHIVINNPNGKQYGISNIIMDGQKLDSNCIPYIEDRREHRIIVTL